ncbi:PilX N-terminal domain-containing pilus assembly protein [Massilia sp. P8910]|uniref:pilus assembly PilX family protein n=1 Tax=Massilia antarctica TaxID=2765360 RepID=UPI001E30C0F3|nr:PilX N-terminal domain-containing pilus assembly protein [Massilia antarctica]MCE3606616.1 PilX N-terminal domain-containing pilus assembly protein [Massilia antarctica]
MAHAPHLLDRQGGAVLLTALFVLLALMIIGVSAARSALDGEKSARHERDRHIAFQAAESALADAERDIEGGSDPLSARAALFARGSALGFVDGCGADTEVNAGLCRHVPARAAWKGADLSGNDGPVPGGVEYGRFTGARLPSGKGTLPLRLPRYLIELLPPTQAGADAARPPANFYRITAIGFGALDTTRVVLQSFYLKDVPEEAP